MNSRSVGPHKLKQTTSANQKMIKQKNKRSISVTMQLTMAPKSVKTKYPERKKTRSVFSEPEELRSVVDTLDTQQDVSVTEYLKDS